MKLSHILAGIVCSLFLSTSVMASDDDVLVTINNIGFKEKDFQAYVKSRIGVQAGEGFPEEKRQQLLQEFVNRELIYLDSVKNKIDKTDEFALQLEAHRKNLMTSIGIRKLLEEMPITEEQLMQLYTQQVLKSASTEYHARHILVESEQQAKDLIIQLNKGADFSELAKSHSTGPSAVDGGDLGWFAANQMVKPFAEAVAKLKNKKYTARPVETQYGWHVIYLEDKRNIEPPSLHSVQDKLEEALQNEIIANYIDDLRQSASIKFAQ